MKRSLWIAVVLIFVFLLAVFGLKFQQNQSEKASATKLEASSQAEQSRLNAEAAAREAEALRQASMSAQREAADRQLAKLREDKAAAEEARLAAEKSAFAEAEKMRFAKEREAMERQALLLAQLRAQEASAAEPSRLAASAKLAADEREKQDAADREAARAAALSARQERESALSLAQLSPTLATDFLPRPILPQDIKRRSHVYAQTFITNDKIQGDLDAYVANANPRDYKMIPVYYATDRRPLWSIDEWRANLRAKGSGYQYFGNDKFELQYGLCIVSVPLIHQPGIVERPRFIKLEFREKPESHFTILGIRPLRGEDFIEEVSRTAEKSEASDAFIFIHGFNVKFSDAAMRAAQLSYDIKFKGAPILFSWRSNGKVVDYVHDGEAAELATPNLVRFLREIAGKSRAKRIHLIAHSMGNRILLNALNELSKDPTPPSFAEIILAAPDVNQEIFFDKIAPNLANIRKLAKRITLYASTDDWALRAAEKISRFNRLGQSGPALVVIRDMETIDASGIDADILGHSYFAEASLVIKDITQIILNGVSPNSASRPLRGLMATGLPYWKIKQPSEQ